MTGRGIAVSACGITKAFEHGLVKALAGIDMQVQTGERVAIMGRTGSGKSTLLAIIALLDTFDDGELLINGTPPSGLGVPELWRAENVGIVFQFHHLLPHLTARENVELPLYGLPRRSRDDFHRARDLLEQLSLGHRADTVAANLSGGERQLAAVARALVNGPRLLLADEPTGNVDTQTGENVLGALIDWSRSTGGTLVVVTHDSTVANAMDRIVELRDGRVIDGPSDLRPSPRIADPAS
ncbi:MAG: hypothetical protein DRH30_08520 [Deltaproteobacteria bacterium]|nr:MAG: hypothetical protein DRH30_08520 [Deltaproteobacteria bacterium]